MSMAQVNSAMFYQPSLARHSSAHHIPSQGSMLSPEHDFGIKVATPIGTLFGQLIFGWLADLFGRKRMYGIELIIIIVGTLGQTLAGQAQGVNIFNVLIVYRFIMGVGIG